MSVAGVVVADGGDCGGRGEAEEGDRCEEGLDEHFERIGLDWFEIGLRLVCFGLGLWSAWSWNCCCFSVHLSREKYWLFMPVECRSIPIYLFYC